MAEMTLILSVLTPTLVAQVSDRRLTKGGVFFNDSANKSVVWCNLAVIGFTGLAFIDRKQSKPTSEWIAETLVGAASATEVVDRLALAAETEVSVLPFLNRHLAISVVGWAPQHAEHPLPFVPFGALVSNFHDELGRVRPLRRTFSRLWQIGVDRFWASDAGQVLTREEQEWLSAGLHRFDRESAAPLRYTSLLAQMVRRVADRVDPLVGRELMAVSLPLSAAGTGMLLTERRGRPTSDGATFFLLPEDSDSPRAFGPMTVCGATATGGMDIEYLNDTGSDVSISVKLLAVPPAPSGEEGPESTPAERS